MYTYGQTSKIGLDIILFTSSGVIRFLYRKISRNLNNAIEITFTNLVILLEKGLEFKSCYF